jgi:hypothetical protein
MAAVDKLRVSLYQEREELIIWAIKHNPSLLYNIYNVFDLTSKEWNVWQEEVTKKCGEKFNKLPIASFSYKQDIYLYWHCPLDFVREYLETQCGYKKANWFVKLFWRY